MTRRNALLASSVALLGIALAATLIVVRNERLGRALVGDAIALQSERMARPVHRGEPLVGTVASCVASVVRESPLPDLSRALPDQKRVVAAELPVSKLPPSEATAYANLWQTVSRLLDCTRRGEIGRAPSVSPLADWRSPQQALALKTAYLVHAVGAMRVVELVDRHDPVGALAVCTDVLAFGRDSVSMFGLIGAMHDQLAVRESLPICEQAIRDAPPSARARVALELRVISDSTPRFDDVMRAERVEMELMTFGQFLPRRLAERLDGDSRGLGQDDVPTKGYSLRQRLGVWLEWAAFDRTMRELADASRLSPARRNERLAVLSARLNMRSRPFGLPNEHPEYETFAARFDEVQTTLALLGRLASE